MCAVFSSLLFPLRAPSLSFCCCPSSSLSVSFLPLVCGSEAAGCMGIGPIQVAHPHCEVCSGWSNPMIPPTPPLQPHHHFSPSLRLFDVSAVNLDHCGRVGGALEACLGGLCMCLKDGRVVGRTSSSSCGPMHLYCRQSDWSFCGYHTAGSAPAVSVSLPFL